jgi:hypothetical protein
MIYKRVIKEAKEKWKIVIEQMQRNKTRSKRQVINKEIGNNRRNEPEMELKWRKEKNRIHSL